MTFHVFRPSLTEIVTRTLVQVANNSCQAVTADYSIDVGRLSNPKHRPIGPSTHRTKEPAPARLSCLPQTLEPHTRKETDMTSVKCPQCGLVNWSTAESCKRCGLAVADGLANDQQMEQAQSDASPAAVNHFPGYSVEEEQLVRRLRRDSYLFYFIGGLQTLALLVVGHLLIVDAVFNVGLSFLANKFRSRVAAIALLLLTLLSVMVVLIRFATGSVRFNPFVPLVLVGRLAVSIRIVYTTFKLNAYADANVPQLMPPLPPAFHNEEGSQWAQPVSSAQWQPE